MKKILILIIYLSAFSTQIFSQGFDIWFYDGRTIHIDDFGYLVGDKVFVAIGKEYKAIDTTDIFAIIQGKDTIYQYKNPNYPLSNAKSFVLGEIYGQKHNFILVNVGAFIIGTISPFILAVAGFDSNFAPLIPAAYIALTSRVYNIIIPNDTTLINFKDYISGYKYSATKKKIKNTSIYAYAGLVTGYLIFIILKSN